MSDQVYQLLGVFGGLAVLLIVVGLAMRADHAALEARLRRTLGLRPIPRASAAEPVRPFSQLEQLRFLRWLRIGVEPRELARAGLPVTPRRFVLFQLLGGLLGAVLGRLAAFKFDYEGPGALLLVTVGALAGLALPRLVLWFLTQRRIGRFERQFPQAVDSLASALEAGLSLPQGIELVGRDMPAPVGAEFGRVFRELGMGIGLNEALAGLADRVRLADVEIFVAAVDIQYRTGGNLSQILRTIAHTIRERLRIRGEIRVLTAQARISAYILASLPVAIYFAMRFFNPNYADKVLEPGTMRLLLFGAVVGIVSGFVVLMRIANIEI
jgi:tight adherence protein B